MNNPPAFPIYCAADQGPSFKDDDWHKGMTLRDYFAAAAMQAAITNPSFIAFKVEDVATQAFVQADAMLKAREQ